MKLHLKYLKNSNASPVEYELKKNKCWECISHAKTSRKSKYRRVYADGKRCMLHRVVYKDYKGDLRSEDVVLHICDNPSCINPSHLKKGSVQDNITDRNNKERQAKGEKISTGKLTKEEVIEIFTNSSMKYNELGRKYGVSKRTVIEIKAQDTWKHVTKGYVVGRRKRTKEEYKKIAKSINRDEKTGKFVK